MEGFTQQVLPILLESWLECGPSEPVKSEESIRCMSLIVSIIRRLIKHLHQLASSSVERKSTTLGPRLLNDLIRYLVPSFPFVVQPAEKKVPQFALPHFLGIYIFYIAVEQRDDI